MYIFLEKFKCKLKKKKPTKKSVKLINFRRFFPFFCFILLLVTIGYKKMEYHTSLVSFADILFAYNKFDSVPTFGLIKPLVGINAYLGSKRLGQNQDISNNCRVGAEIEVILVNFIACKIQFSIKNQIYSYFEKNYILCRDFDLKC